AIVDAMKELPAAQVRAYWESLDAGRQQHLIREFSDIIGNLSGIPFTIRTRANKRTAQEYIDHIKRDHPDLDQEIADLEKKKSQKMLELGSDYIGYSADYDSRIRELLEIRDNLAAAESITNGRDALLFDPHNDRIITVSGDINTPADHYVVYAPGTNTSMASFGTGVNDLGDGIINELRQRGASGVVFTVKDGPWSSFGLEGNSAIESEMAQRGEKINNFVNDLRLEDFDPNAEIVGAGYSSGMSKVGTAETMGAVFDEVISIAGSFPGTNWLPDPHAEYTHIQYADDALQAYGWFTRLPGEIDSFNKYDLAPPSGGGINNHSRIGEGPTTNPKGIQRIADEIVD
ncbi:hypothetical protein, partial [Gulosibacter bifidus]